MSGLCAQTGSEDECRDWAFSSVCPWHLAWGPCTVDIPSALVKEEKE